MPIELMTTGLGVPVGSTLPLTRAGTEQEAPAGDGFASALGRLLDGVNETNAAANTAVAQMMDKTVDVHDAMIALQRAEMTLQFTVQVRNKLVHAYQDIMRMPL